MERDDLVRRLTTVSGGLRSLFHGEFGQWFDRVVLEAMPFEEGDRRLDADRLYEVLCYLVLVANVRCDQIRLKTPGDKVRLPYGPAKKGNFAYFELVVHEQTYDLCNGTAVDTDNPSEPEEHPDISLQETPKGGRAGALLAIWDAKYTRGRRLRKDALTYMTYWFNVLPVEKPSASDILHEVCPPSFELSALITNAQATRLNERIRKERGFGIVFSFDGSNVALRAVPSRTAVLAGAVESS